MMQTGTMALTSTEIVDQRHQEDAGMEELEAVQLFQRWFVIPLNKLKELPDGDGGFVALIAGLTLFERLTVAKIKLTGEKPTAEAVKREMAHELGLSQDEQAVFWDIFRNGLLHHAMPKAGRTGWLFHHAFGDQPVFETIDGRPVILIDPWKFVDRVLMAFMSKPALILASESFPLPIVVQISFDQVT